MARAAAKHLAVLAAAATVGRPKEGADAFYSITAPVVFEICEIVRERLVLSAKLTSRPFFRFMRASRGN